MAILKGVRFCDTYTLARFCKFTVKGNMSLTLMSHGFLRQTLDVDLGTLAVKFIQLLTECLDIKSTLLLQSLQKDQSGWRRRNAILMRM